MILKGKIAIITGAYAGFGLALGRRLASAKVKLVISGRNEEKLDAVLKEFKQQTEVIAVKADVTKIMDCKRLIDACVKHYGRVDLMINNAGVLEDGLRTKTC